MTALVGAPGGKRVERRTLAAATGAHALHDGYTDLLYVMLPIWQAEFGLSYAAIGALRAAFTGAMAGLQIPAGRLAERFGAARMLAAGTALAGFGYCIAGASTGFTLLVIALLMSGIGASTQHPIASAAVARVFSGARSMKALGSYNFAGDLGKMIVPALGALLIVWMPWRAALTILGAAGLVAALAILLGMPRVHATAETSAPHEKQSAPLVPRGPFTLLLGIGIIDSAARMAFLTFLPFLLTAKGASLPTIGIALTLVFAGGAAGKLICAHIGARIGVIGTVFLTETLTALLVAALLVLPLNAILITLPFLGAVLNGTSSVLYGSVPDLVDPLQRNRAFGIFYTGTIGSGAIAPLIYGFIGDALGLTWTVALIACIALASLPLAFLLRPAFRR